MMKHVTRLFAVSFAILVAWMPAISFAQDPNPPSLSTTPSPPPADQPFAAALRIFVNPATAGLWSDQIPSQYRIDGNVIEILFDMGCGFLCPPSESAYTTFPFTMPALPAGPHVVRFVGGFGPPNPVYAEFNLAVGGGNGGTIVPSALPVGGIWSALLGGTLLLFSWAWIRRQRNH